MIPEVPRRVHGLAGDIPSYPRARWIGRGRSSNRRLRWGRLLDVNNQTSPNPSPTELLAATCSLLTVHVSIVRFLSRGLDSENGKRSNREQN
jgi:hypothetical protein